MLPINKAFNGTTYARACAVIREIGMEPAKVVKRTRWFTEDQIATIQARLIQDEKNLQEILATPQPEGTLTLAQIADQQGLGPAIISAIFQAAGIKPSQKIRTSRKGKPTGVYPEKGVANLFALLPQLKQAYDGKVNLE